MELSFMTWCVNFAKNFIGERNRIMVIYPRYVRDVSPLLHFSFLIIALPLRWNFSLHHYHRHNRPFHIQQPRRIEFLYRTSIVRLCVRFSNRSSTRSLSNVIYRKKKAAQSTHVATIYSTERAISYINQRSDLRQHLEKNNRAIKLKNFAVQSRATSKC